MRSAMSPCGPPATLPLPPTSPPLELLEFPSEAGSGTTVRDAAVAAQAIGTASRHTSRPSVPVRFESPGPGSRPGREAGRWP